jgi:Cu/Ag efflux protein CusF
MTLRYLVIGLMPLVFTTAVSAHPAVSGRQPFENTATGALRLIHESGDNHATGKVNSIDPASHKVNISHKAIKSLGWPAMTMDFAVASSVDLSSIKPGTEVEFSIEKNKAGGFEIHSIKPVSTK